MYHLRDINNNWKLSRFTLVGCTELACFQVFHEPWKKEKKNRVGSVIIRINSSAYNEMKYT